MLFINGSLVMAILDSVPQFGAQLGTETGVRAVHAVPDAGVAGGRPVDDDRLRSQQIQATIFR